jgi:hypothetical protein
VQVERLRTLANEIDEARGGGAAIEHRGRPTQHLRAFKRVSVCPKTY